MAKTTQWNNGSLPEVVAASVLRVADLLHVSSEDTCVEATNGIVKV